MKKDCDIFKTIYYSQIHLPDHGYIRLNIYPETPALIWSLPTYVTYLLL